MIPLRPGLALTLSLGALAACDAPSSAPGAVPAEPSVAAPSPPEATSPPPTPVPTPTSDPEVQRDCLLVVDGVTRVEGRCWVYPMGDGGLTLNTWTHGKPEQSHFAVIGVTRPGVADASWNKDPNDTHAWDPLGEVTLQDGCWTNARVRVCAR